MTSPQKEVGADQGNQGRARAVGTGLSSDDQAASRLDAPRFDPSRWQDNRYSPNLNRWLKAQAKRWRSFPAVYRDRDNMRWIGWIDDTDWFIGCRLMRCLTVGARSTTGAYPTPARELTEERDFWSRYDRIGRCAIDEKHVMAFIDEQRWAVNGDSRSCQWCGQCEQTLKRWTETVERSRWVNCDSDGSGEAGETGTGSTEGDSAGRQASPEPQVRTQDTEGTGA